MLPGSGAGRRRVWQHLGQDAVSGPSRVPDLDASIREDESVAPQDVPFFQQYENSDPPELPPPDHSAGDPWSQAFKGDEQPNKLGHKLRTRTTPLLSATCDLFIF